MDENTQEVPAMEGTSEKAVQPTRKSRAKQAAVVEAPMVESNVVLGTSPEWSAAAPLRAEGWLSEFRGTEPDGFDEQGEPVTTVLEGDAEAEWVEPEVVVTDEALEALRERLTEVIPAEPDAYEPLPELVPDAVITVVVPKELADTLAESIRVATGEQVVVTPIEGVTTRPAQPRPKTKAEIAQAEWWKAKWSLYGAVRRYARGEGKGKPGWHWVLNKDEGFSKEAVFNLIVRARTPEGAIKKVQARLDEMMADPERKVVGVIGDGRIGGSAKEPEQAPLADAS